MITKQLIGSITDTAKFLGLDCNIKMTNTIVIVLNLKYIQNFKFTSDLQNINDDDFLKEFCDKLNQVKADDFFDDIYTPGITSPTNLLYNLNEDRRELQRFSRLIVMAYNEKLKNLC